MNKDFVATQGPPQTEQDMEKMIEQYEGASSKRNFTGFFGQFIAFIAAIFTLFFLYQGAFGVVSPEANRGVYVGITIFLCLLIYPASKKSPNDKITILDALLGILTLVTTCYFIFMYPQMAYRIGFVTTPDLIMAIIAILLALETVRRVTGNILFFIALGFLLYAYFGNLLPGMLSHKGFSITRIASFMYASLYGIYGSVASIFASFVFLFITFGTFLEYSGAGRFFIDFPYSLLGRARGGPAKVAVLASGFMGSINGSATANVVTTGTFTIPLMKRVGYKPHMAGAIETVASTGGMLMPPIMGAGAFIMAEFTGIPYWDIVKVSIIPAILYYLYLYLMVDFQAHNLGLKGLNKSELPNPMEVFKSGWYFIIPVIVIIYMLIAGYSPPMAAVIAVVLTIICSWFNKETRMYPKDIFNALAKSAITSLTVGATVGAIGVIIGVVYLTGLGLKFSDIMLSLSGGFLPLAIVFVAVASYALGMGVTATTSYIILGVLASPALQELGVALLPAHLIIFWASQIANVNPPVCLAAFAAAAIAKAEPMKTGLTSMIFAQPLYIMPFVFAYAPAILLVGEPSDIYRTIASVTLGMILAACFFQNWMLRKLMLVERLIMAVGAILLILAGSATDYIGFIIAGAIFIFQLLTRNKKINKSLDTAA
ncbi:TRAP transporter, 4TM/12TM fusion protein [Desulfotomaculum arcticum]|uniref:TRAP transporter, 4TM/12TM fusion protein n=1 Tax=Desulfotruncus arcticus DSM 17038 TaxID=1121424 RepID=A0A1I2YNF2_9FIRM|nr:TRAP transporter permease [Desulfotruncus arcticus]SFH27132.1 TRAP transporter, 4TM/12TM fusion protein [Desulfotomaculum arcticum] [Desulfotruncus arcticus DSM 17038]